MPEHTVPSTERLASGTYQLDPSRSTISYRGRHMFGLGVVRATFGLTTGELRVTEGLSGSTAVVTVDAASFLSNNPKRDRDVRSATLLDAETYPAITFESEGLRRQGDGWVLPGTVTAHGTPVAVEVQVDRIERDGQEVRVHGHARHLDRYAFNVVKGKGMVGRYLDLDLDVVGTPA